MRGQDELGFDVDPFEKAFGQFVGPVHWPSLTQTERLQAFADLREWVEQLVDRFSIEIRVIPPCWYRHNGMVEALSALRDHERMSFSDHGSFYGPACQVQIVPLDTGAVLAAQTGATLAELMAWIGHSTPQEDVRHQHAAVAATRRSPIRSPRWLPHMRGKGEG